MRATKLAEVEGVLLNLNLLALELGRCEGEEEAQQGDRSDGRGLELHLERRDELVRVLLLRAQLGAKTVMQGL